MRSLSLILLSLIASLTGCAQKDAGTSTGNPSPDDPDAGGTVTDPDHGLGSEGGFGYCEAGDKTVIDVDEETALGFTAEDILAFAAGTHEETIHWLAPMNTTFGPESGDHAITITVTHDGDVRFVEPSTEADGTEDDLLTDIGRPQGCTPWLEIDVHVTVETDGGALDESFDATLRTHNRLIATLFTHPDPDALGGDFEASFGIDGFVLGQLDLGMTFSENGVNGAFGGVFEMHTADAVAAGAGGDFAAIGDARCGTGNLAVGLNDQIAGNTLQGVLDAAAAHDEATITWQDATTTISTLAFTPDESTGCVLLDDSLVGDVAFTLVGKLAMVSEDGRLDGEWNGTLQATLAADDTVARIHFQIEAEGLPAVTEPGAAAAYGFPMEDVSGFDSAAIYAGVVIEDGALSGMVGLTGYTLAECAGGDPDEEMEPAPDVDPDVGGGGTAGSTGGGSAGCRGSDPTELATGTIE